jgi:hypothetical protein
MTTHIPEQPPESVRLTLVLNHRQPRLDTILLEAIRAQEKNLELKRISRTAYKTLFNEKKILIKGQAAKPSSSLAAGTTYVDILGYEEE